MVHISPLPSDVEDGVRIDVRHRRRDWVVVLENWYPIWSDASSAGGGKTQFMEQPRNDPTAVISVPNAIHRGRLPLLPMWLIQKAVRIGPISPNVKSNPDREQQLIILAN